MYVVVTVCLLFTLTSYLKKNTNIFKAPEIQEKKIPQKIISIARTPKSQELPASKGISVLHEHNHKINEF